MRERRDMQTGKPIPYGITPARAGKTCVVSFQWCMIEDHPRSCGKDHDAGREIGLLTGSPPLVRERQNQKVRRTGVLRITPARAGKTE